MQEAYSSCVAKQSIAAGFTHSNLLQMDIGSDHQSSARNIKDIAQPSSENIMVPVSFSERNKTDLGHASEERLPHSHSAAFDRCPTDANEVYLETLRETIAEWGGSLGDGWHVEFVFCEKRFKTFPVYNAPDGSKFESMSDVAFHLGLQPSCNIRETKCSDNGSATLQKVSGASRKRKDWVGSSRPSSRGQRQNCMSSSGIGSSAGMEIINNHEVFSELNCFPVQFEDFFLISAGNVDLRPAYHTTSQVFPVGYKSTWHDKITGSLFVCEVADGGDEGPIFKVRRHPCITQSIPIGLTVLRPKVGLSDMENKIEGECSAASIISGVVDEDASDIQIMLTECSPPHLENNLSLNDSGNEDCGFERLMVPTSDIENLSGRCGSTSYEVSAHMDVIGEFVVEERSTSLVWEVVAQAFLKAFSDKYKLNGTIQFVCNHVTSEPRTNNIGSLSRFSHSAAPDNIPHIIDGDDKFKVTCEMLEKWLGEDRFGLDAEFVQEIIEGLPGVTACTGYKNLNLRSENSTQQTVGSGFLMVQKKSKALLNRDLNDLSGSFKKLKSQSVEPERDPVPPGEPVSSSLPACLMGDALQAWEFLWRFSELVGVEEPISFQELELELLNPWLDRFHPLVKPWPSPSNISGIDRNIPKARVVCQSRIKCTGLILAQMHGSLLKILAGELLSRVAVHVDPNFDFGESKSKRGRKKESEIPATVKKIMLDLVPINEVTWPDVARRYVLAVLAMECNLDSSEIACRESGKVFHCLRGDGGTLSGSLTGVAGLEADAMLLAEATKNIFGSLKSGSDITVECKLPDSAGSSKITEMKTESTPEWALALEPVRKLPTNVGARIRKCIHEALEKNPPEWARRVLEHSISKEVYKGNASGPTKRAVVSVLTDLGQRIVPEKPEKKENDKCIVNTVSDLVIKQCRIVLRRAAAADKDRVFCNLLGRTLLKVSDNDDEGLLGHPAMVSRPLDFRSIDLRLAAGAYSGSHEAFFDDVQEVWHNIRTAYKEQPDCIKLADRLSKIFEEMYHKEVLTIVQKTAECASINSANSAALKERDDLLAYASENLIPKAPWEEGICKVCGMDKDDDNVLLCDGCDSEYHTYCLSPPLVRIPEGNWYCPSCVGGQSTYQSAAGGSHILNQCKRKKLRREYTQKYMETLAQLANTMLIKEYWEFKPEERIFLLKFLCDEALNTAVFRDHMDQCASMSADLQQKLRSLTSELKIQKFREEFSGVNSVKDDSLHTENSEPGTDVLASANSNDNKSMGRPPDDNGDIIKTNGENVVLDVLLSGNRVGAEDKLPATSQQQEKDQREDSSGNAFDSKHNFGHCTSQMLSSDQRVESEIPPLVVDSTDTLHGSKSSNQAVIKLLKSHDAECGTQKNEISGLQDAIATVQLELLKVSIRKEFLGRDSHGRLYWNCSRPNCCPCIIANSVSGNLPSSSMLPYDAGNSPTSTEFGVQKWYSSEKIYNISSCPLWMSFNSDSQIEELVDWLQDSDEREKELKESILQWRRGPPKLYANDFPCKKEVNPIITTHDEMELDPDFPVTRALTKLKKEVGSCPEPMPLGTQKYQVLRVKESAIYRCECLEPLWSSRHHCLVCHETFLTSEELVHHTSKSCKTWTSIPKSSYLEQETPFNLEEIMAKFSVPNSLKELVNQVGDIGVKGANSESISMLNLVDQSSSNAESGTHVGPVAENKNSKSVAEENQYSLAKDKGPLLGVIKTSLVHEVAQRPLVGRVSEILRILKINLLDMDAALPEEALRTSRSNSDRRRAWRLFTKYAGTIYEMIQAAITLEDMIKSEYLRNDWWYWSSPSAAAKITTISALALRIFTLDSAILYEKSLADGDSTQAPEPDTILDPEAPQKPGSPSVQRTPDSDIPENTRTRSRASKRKRDPAG